MKKALSSYGVEKVDYILSGLPFLSLPPDVRTYILENIHDCLEGKLILFQYTTLLENNFKSFFEIEHVERVILNFPPAYVYTLNKKWLN